VSCLAEVLGVDGGTEAEGAAGAELDIVGDGCDAAVVDFALLPKRVSIKQECPCYTSM
jgi:hypothetical protein